MSDLQGLGCSDECPLYKQMCQFKRMYMNPEFYAPYDQMKMVDRQRDDSISSCGVFFEKLFGRHVCTLKEMIEIDYCKEVYDGMVESSNFKLSGKYYNISRYAYFRAFFSLFLVGKLRGQQVESFVSTFRHVGDVSEQMLSLYFHDVDIFHVFDKVVPDKRKKGKNDDVEYFVYNEKYYDIKAGKYQREVEYFECILKDYDKDAIFLKYKNFLRDYLFTKPMWANEYDDPASFSYFFQKQVGMYLDVIKDLDKQLIFYSDGPGTGSYAAYLAGKDYLSYEPNDIGRIAKIIGLIKEGDVKNDAIHIYCNCIEHYTDEEISCHDRVIVIDEQPREISNMLPVMSGGAKVFVKNVYLHNLVSFPIQNSRFLLEKMGVVSPVDYRSKVLCQIMGVKISNDGRRVTTDVNGEDFNMVTRNDPKNLRVKKKGDYKRVRGRNYKLYPGENVIMTENGMAMIRCNKYSMDRYVTEYIEHQGYYYVRTPVPERVERIRRKDTDEIIRVFLVKKVRYKDVIYGIFRDTRLLTIRNMEDDRELHVREEEDWIGPKGDSKISLGQFLSFQ